MARRPASLRALTLREAESLGALARALFPRDKHVDVDWDDADVVARLDDYAARLPPPQRQNLHALLAGTEAAWMAHHRRPGALGDASPDEVVAFVDAWSTHDTYTLRQAWLAIKSLLAFAYVEAPEVLEAIGARPRMETA